VWGLIAAVLLLAGCEIILVSAYDATTDRGVTEIQRALEQHLTKLEALAAEPPGLESLVEECDPAKFAGTYQALQTDVRALILRNEARERNTLTVDQLKLLRSNIGSLQALQQERYAPTDPARRIEKPGDRCLSAAPIEASRRILEQNLLAILKLELAKRDFRKEE
jgi:hypothetical protein